MERKEAVGADLLDQNNQRASEPRRCFDQLASLEKIFRIRGNAEVPAVLLACCGVHRDSQIAVFRPVSNFVIDRSMIDGDSQNGVLRDIVHTLAPEIHQPSIPQTRFILLDRSQSHDPILFDSSTPVPAARIFEPFPWMFLEVRLQTRFAWDIWIRRAAHGSSRRGSPQSVARWV